MPAISLFKKWLNHIINKWIYFGSQRSLFAAAQPWALHGYNKLVFVRKPNYKASNCWKFWLVSAETNICD